MNSLFSDNGIQKTETVSDDQTVRCDSDKYSDRIQRSALWAAYGDALGWISELTDLKGLRRRIRGDSLHEPVRWNRRIGGRSGVVVELPRGCYSDDSQLRLATSRAVRSDGFDVEAFAKVELPVWLSYALGGGRSTVAAAANMAKKSKLQWFNNTFRGWTESGGNGAAMRVQPHVWSARTPGDASSFLPDVVRNAVCTHSHPHGLMGAAIHALCLARTLVSGGCSSPEDLLGYVGIAERLLPEIIESDRELTYWRIAYEEDAGNFGGIWEKTVIEAKEAVTHIASVCDSGKTGEEGYDAIVEKLNLRDPAKRGSGMLTAVAAAGLTLCEKNPKITMRTAVNALGTDTDTIATMAGAILGAAIESDPPSDSVLDEDLFRLDASRLAEIAGGGNPEDYEYPDLIRWSAPKSRADTLVRLKDESLFVRGLGPVAEVIGEPFSTRKDDFRWQWLKLKTGQTLLIKHRKGISECFGESTSMAFAANGQEAESFITEPDNRSTCGKSVDAPRTDSAKTASRIRGELEKSSLKDVLLYVEKHIDNDEKIGLALRRVVNKGTKGQVLEFTAKLVDLLDKHRRG